MAMLNSQMVTSIFTVDYLHGFDWRSRLKNTHGINDRQLNKQKTSMVIHYGFHSYPDILVGGWPTRLKNMSSSNGKDDNPYMKWKIKFHGSKAPTRWSSINHQPFPT